MTDVLMQAAAAVGEEEKQQAERRASVSSASGQQLQLQQQLQYTASSLNLSGGGASSAGVAAAATTTAMVEDDKPPQPPPPGPRDSRDLTRTREDVLYDIARLKSGEQVTLRVAANRRDKIDVIRIGQAPFAYNGKKDGSWIPDGIVIHTRADKVDYIVETKVVGPMLVEFSFTPAIEKSPGKWEKDPTKSTFTDTSALKAYNDAYKYMHKTSGTLKGANARLIMGIHYPHMQDLIKKMFNLQEPPTSEAQASKKPSKPKKRSESDAHLSDSTAGRSKKQSKEYSGFAKGAGSKDSDGSDSDIHMKKTMGYSSGMNSSSLNWMGDSREYTGLVALASMAVQTPRTAAAAAAAAAASGSATPSSVSAPPPPPPPPHPLAWPSSPPATSSSSSLSLFGAEIPNL